jgi:hypothetical protein
MVLCFLGSVENTILWIGLRLQDAGCHVRGEVAVMVVSFVAGRRL